MESSVTAMTDRENKLHKNWSRALVDADSKFGHGEWSHSLKSLTVDFVDLNRNSETYEVGVSSVVQISFKDGTFHEDVGYFYTKGLESKPASIAKARRLAVKDGMINALRTAMTIKAIKIML